VATTGAVLVAGFVLGVSSALSADEPETVVAVVTDMPAEESVVEPIAGVESVLADESEPAPTMIESFVESVERTAAPSSGRTRSEGPGRVTRWIGGADYLLLRPSFSNSTAMLTNTRSGGLVGFTPVTSSLNAVNYDFGYSGGVRGFLGYQATPDHVFRFTYMNFYAQATSVGLARGNWAGGNGTIVIGPYNTGADTPGESINSTASVGLNVYDLEWARRIDVATDCGRSPAWDAAAGAGIRFLDSRVSSYVFNNVLTAGFPDLAVTTSRNFWGVGPRVAGQVRRYVGPERRWSGFASVGGSLLVGGVSNTDTRLTLDADQTFESQTVGGTIVIPNVDVSLGGSWQIRPRTSLSFGWMLMYFGNLGYAETVTTTATPTGTPVTSVPLTNSSLSLDGFFFRLAHSF